MIRPLRPVTGSDVKYAVITNSQTLSVGEVIVPGAGASATTGGGTTAALLGVVLSIVGDNGKVLEKNSHAAAADNQTVAKVQVAYLPFYIPMEFSATLDDDAGTTSGSGGFGNLAVDSTGLLLDESTYVAYTTIAAKQFFSYGNNNGGTSRSVTCHYTRNVGI